MQSTVNSGLKLSTLGFSRHLVKSYQFAGIDFGRLGQNVQNNRKQSGIFARLLFFTTKVHFLKAIANGNFLSWPGLTTINIQKNLLFPIATAKGHLNQERSNLRSTKTNPLKEILDPNIQADFFPDPETVPPERTYDSMAMFVPFQERNTAYSDLTGKFPHTSSQGNTYLLAIYDYDSNSILVEPIKYRATAVIQAAWKKLTNILISKGRKPNMYILDNECSNELKHAMLKNKILYQRVPPHVHRRNAAERAIQTFKHHFLAGLASADPDYPTGEWDRLLPQAVLTLNLLRNSRVNPKLSAHAFLHGNFNVDATHLPLLELK